MARLRRVGRSSERVDPGQLALLLEELAAQLSAEGEPALDVESEAREDAVLEHDIEEEEKARPAKRPERRCGWRTRNVPREVHPMAVAPEERTCSHCGRPKRKISVDVSRELDYVPGYFVEREYHREKWACGRCKRGVSMAPLPPKVMARSAASPALLAHIVVSKYGDHTPLHRLHRIYDRTGATIPVSTLSDWVREVADRVAPLVDRIAQRIVEDACVVSTDATALRVLDPSSISPTSANSNPVREPPSDKNARRLNSTSSSAGSCAHWPTSPRAASWPKLPATSSTCGMRSRAFSRTDASLSTTTCASASSATSHSGARTTCSPDPTTPHDAPRPSTACCARPPCTPSHRFPT